jgi:CAAX protease family protein
MDNHEQHQLKFHILLIAAALVVFSDLLLSKVLNIFLIPIITIMIIRITQIIMLFILLRSSNPLNLKLSGLSYQNLIKGIKTGIYWSVFLGIAALTFYLFFNIIGINSLKYLTIILPNNNFETILFFITGGIVAPIAEEIFFRGLIYTYFRKYSILGAIILSTTFFALFHLPLNFFPIIQIIGGIIFALSFEYSENLAAPIIIHVFGNLAIFSLSFYN